jgi:hypothetical protein
VSVSNCLLAPSSQPSSNPSIQSEIYTLSECNRFTRLEQYAHQHFLSRLNIKALNNLVQAAFPNMSLNHPIYQTAITKVRSLYKVWKFRTLQEAKACFNTWLEISRNRAYSKEINPCKLKGVLNKQYSKEWTQQIFRWSTEAVSINNCTSEGLAFLRYIYSPIS